MTYSGPRTLASSEASIPARSTGLARAGLSRSTTAPQTPGSRGPTGSPGARPASASQTFIRVSTYVTEVGLPLHIHGELYANGEWRLGGRQAGTRAEETESAER